MKICIMGLGYIGFPTACLLAHAGNQVLGVDINSSVLDTLRQGKLHILNEPGLAETYEAALANGSLVIGDQPAAADAFIIAVPTPFQHDDSSPGSLLDPAAIFRADLRYVESATRTIAPLVQPGNLVILESTVPPGTTEQVVRRALQEEGVDVNSVLIAHAPERVLPGNVMYELVYNDRIVGGLTPEAGEAAARLYRTFVRGDISITDARTAELVKLMENTYRDVNIALANEFARICEYLDLDAWEAITLANRHPRVNFLRPGPGVGGHCIAVDPYFVIEAAPALTDLIQTARKVNRRMPVHVVDLLRDLAGDEPVQRVALLGAAYKANVCDDRESPSLEIAKLLRDMNIDVVVHDPCVQRFNIPIDDALRGVDAILLATDHEFYRSLDPHHARRLVAKPLLLDTRNFLEHRKWESAGFKVRRLGVGRGVSESTGTFMTSRSHVR